MKDMPAWMTNSGLVFEKTVGLEHQHLEHRHRREGRPFTKARLKQKASERRWFMEASSCPFLSIGGRTASLDGSEVAHCASRTGFDCCPGAKSLFHVQTRAATRDAQNVGEYHW